MDVDTSGLAAKATEPNAPISSTPTPSTEAANIVAASAAALPVSALTPRRPTVIVSMPSSGAGRSAVIGIGVMADARGVKGQQRRLQVNSGCRELVDEVGEVGGRP